MNDLLVIIAINICCDRDVSEAEMLQYGWRYQLTIAVFAAVLPTGVFAVKA